MIEVDWTDSVPHYYGLRFLRPKGKSKSKTGPDWLGMVRNARGVTEWTAYAADDGRELARGEAPTQELAMRACEEAAGVARRTVYVAVEKTERWLTRT